MVLGASFRDSKKKKNFFLLLKRYILSQGLIYYFYFCIKIVKSEGKFKKRRKF